MYFKSRSGHLHLLTRLQIGVINSSRPWAELNDARGTDVGWAWPPMNGTLSGLGRRNKLEEHSPVHFTLLYTHGKLKI
jgi:hypothetical protein